MLESGNGARVSLSINHEGVIGFAVLKPKSVTLEHAAVTP